MAPNHARETGSGNFVRAGSPTPAHPTRRQSAEREPRKGSPNTILLMLRIAWADVAHERGFSICAVVALAAVVTPLILLFAIKEGAMEKLRTRLIEDPRNREIRPISSARFDLDWFDRIAENPSVAFVVPATRGLASTGTFRHPHAGRSAEVDLSPTAEGDPLIVENRCRVPGQRECVLTDASATAAGARVGDDLDLVVHRLRNGEIETAALSLRVTGILPASASGLNVAFLQVGLMEAIEDFKDGRAVASLDWPGEKATASPVYEGVCLLTPFPLPPSRLEAMARENRCNYPETLTDATVRARYGMECPPGGRAYIFGNGQAAFDHAAATQLAAAISKGGGRAFPWVAPRDVVLEDSGGHALGSLRVVGVPGLSRPGDLLPGFEFLQTHRTAKTNDGLFLLVPRTGQRVAWPTEARMVGRSAKSKLELPISIHPIPPASADVGYVSMELLAMLNTSRLKKICYDPVHREFEVVRDAYSGFRLYAADIRSVSSLQRDLEEQGLKVATEGQRIDEVLTLDRNVSLVFWLISSVGVAGLVAFLAATLLSSVERKRRSLGVLALLGLPANRLALFPIFQSMLLMLIAGSIAYPAAAGVACVVELCLSGRFGFAGLADGIGVFRPRTVLFFFALALALAGVTAAIAAARIRKCDLSASLRQEQ